jgi:hypothetical protein
MAIKERSLEDALQSMNELIDMQQKAIRMADELIKLKDARLNVADRLMAIYKKENRVLKICFYLLVAFNIITSLITLL